jgi:uncharacterized metal-binding protein
VNRRAHALSTVALAGAVAPAGFLAPDAWLVAGGAALGLLLHPDLDQGRTPYGAVRKHRGLSHWPLVGTLDRLLWFVGPVLAAWLAAGRAVDWEGLALVLGGLVLSDLLHAALDGFPF